MPSSLFLPCLIHSMLKNVKSIGNLLNDEFTGNNLISLNYAIELLLVSELY